MSKFIFASLLVFGFVNVAQADIGWIKRVSCGHRGSPDTLFLLPDGGNGMISLTIGGKKTIMAKIDSYIASEPGAYRIGGHRVHSLGIPNGNDRLILRVEERVPESLRIGENYRDEDPKVSIVRNKVGGFSGSNGIDTLIEFENCTVSDK